MEEPSAVDVAYNVASAINDRVQDATDVIVVRSTDGHSNAIIFNTEDGYTWIMRVRRFEVGE